MPTPLTDETTTYRLMISIDNLYEGEAQSEPLYAEIELEGDVIEEMHCYRFSREGKTILVDFQQEFLYIPFDPFPKFQCLDSQTEKVLASFEVTAENQLVPLDGVLLNQLTEVIAESRDLPKTPAFPNEGIRYGLRTTGCIIADQDDNESALDFLTKLGVPELLDQHLGL